jgi:hypothetical protein
MTASPQPGEKSLLVVESPFQLLCAFEIISRYRVDYVLVLRMSGVGRNDEQLRLTAKILRLSYVEVVARVGMLKRDLLRAWLRLMPLLRHRYAHLFLGSYYSGFMRALRRILRSGRTWILDDGLATLRAQADMLRIGQADDLATFLELNALPGQAILHHRLESVAALGSTKYVDKAMFLGQPFIEHGIVSKNEYNQIVRRCSEATEAPLIYVPHRSESTKRISELQQSLGLDIHYPPMCIELDLVRNGEIPRRVFTVMSTAGFTIARMFPDATVTIFPEPLQGSNAHLGELVAHAQSMKNMNIETAITASGQLP